MKRVLPLLALALLSACETRREPVHAPVENVSYSALGHDPFWLLTIGDDRMVLTLGHEGGRADGELASWTWPRVLPRDVDGMRRWEASGPGGSILVETRPGPCQGSDGRRFADRVRVVLADRTLTGCGGRLLTGREG